MMHWRWEGGGGSILGGSMRERWDVVSTLRWENILLVVWIEVCSIHRYRAVYNRIQSSVPSLDHIPTLIKACYLRTATTLHHTLELWHISTESLFLIGIPVPALLERIEIEFHNLWQNLALSFLLDAVNQLVEDPRAGHELGIC